LNINKEELTKISSMMLYAMLMIVSSIPHLPTHFMKSQKFLLAIYLK